MAALMRPGFGPMIGQPARTRLRAARIVRIERGWPRLLPALATCCGFAVLTELALPQRLPLWLHLLLVLLLVGIVCERLWHMLRQTPRATAAELDRRIEQRSGLPHRPLTTLSDRPAIANAAAPDAMRDAIWQAHRLRTAAQLGTLRAGWPRLGLWRHGWGRLTLALLALLAVCAIVSGPAALDRLASGFLPGLFELPGPAPWMQAWITPPDYARAAPVFLEGRSGETTMPFGSVLQVNLTGVNGSPRVLLRNLDAAHPDQTADGPALVHFERLSEGSWSLTHTLHGSILVALRGNGRHLAEWTIRVSPLPPTLVAWDGKPGASSEPWRTRLPWRVGDPYGLNSLSAEIRLAQAGAPARAPGNIALRTLRVPIPLAPGTREARGVALPDLSADPRAGESVIARLAATDVNGVTSRGPEARFTLPARPFRNPLARAVLDTRKRLALGRESRAEAATDLEALGEAPGQFASDSGMFLNLASIAALLRSDDVTDEAAIDEASGRLWELALALEDGLHNDRRSARAAADVRAAREAVSAQLERMRELGDKGQSEQEQSELQRRIQALSQAIARRMQALAEQARREHTVLPPMPDAKMLNGDDLARMMQQMREDALHGRPQDAMQRLAQMQSMLDRMRAATPRDVQNAQAEAAVARRVREQMQGLQDMVRRQSGLLDQTQARRNALDKERREQAPAELDPQTAELLRRLGIPQTDTEAAPSAGDETPPNPAEDSQEQADEEARAHERQEQPTAQEPAETAPKLAANKAAEQARAAQRSQDARVQRGLARALDELGQEFRELSGQRPAGFDAAGRDMDEARKALTSGQDQQAQQAQQQALADLQKGASQMRQTLSANAGGSPMLMPGMADGSGGDTPGDGEDQEQDGQGPRDPLGRPVASGPRADDGETHVPDRIEQMRAREIEQELRRRDTDRTRPADELNYLDRLLKPF